MTTEERLLSTVTPGQLQHRVSIMAPTLSIDDYGNQKETYEEVGKVWAYIETHAAQTYETAGEVHIVRKSIVVIRYREGITPKTRYVEGNRIYRPTGAPIDACGKHRLIYIECVEELEDNESG